MAAAQPFDVRLPDGRLSQFSYKGRIDPVPERPPGIEILRQPGWDVPAGPVVERRRRPLFPIGTVPVLFAPPDEVPFPVTPGVVVKIGDGHDDPFAAILVFGAAVGNAPRQIGRYEIYAMAAQLMNCAVTGAQIRLDNAAQHIATCSMTAAIDVINEQSDPSIDVARVYSQGITDR